MYIKRYIRKSAQSGQASVLMGLTIIGIGLFVLLALQAGKYLSDRRWAQNTADFGAGAGSFTFSKTWDNTAATVAVNTNAKLNGFDNTTPGVVVKTTITDYPDQLHYPQAKVLGVYVQADEAVVFPIASFDKLVFSAYGSYRILPQRILASGAGAMVGFGACNNAVKVSAGAFDIAVGVSNQADLDGSSAYGVFGQTYHYGGSNLSAQVTTGQDTQMTKPLPIYGMPIMSEYLAGEVEANAVQAAGIPIVFISGNQRFNFNQLTPADVNGKVYVVDGNIDTIGNPSGDLTITWLATGTISFAAKNISVKPVWKGITLYSDANNGCGSNVITFSSDTLSVWGLVAAGYGGCKLSDHTSVFYGAMVCYTVQASTSSTKFLGNPLQPVIAPAQTDQYQ